MHAFSIVTFGIFVAGYTTARWDLVTRLYELAVFAWEYGVITRAAKCFIGLTFLFLTLFVPVAVLASRESSEHPRNPSCGVSGREQLRRRGSLTF
ncbi:uncharacterized protein BROUX77_000805 [Berkeleyomyces rouxiae]|uniref:uncharacterized protein n=1 Tax=Berkeleyomyces rouxiae TaxID=2035830 RepID=UPI003B7D08E2